MKRDVIEVAGKKCYKDLYVVGKLLPAVIEGLEELSREVEILMTDEGTRQLTQRPWTPRCGGDSTRAYSWRST